MLLSTLLIWFLQPKSVKAVESITEPDSSFIPEGLFVILIIGIQLWLFFKTRNRIVHFRQTLPTVDNLSIHRMLVDTDALKQMLNQRMAPRALLERVADLAILDPSKPHTELTLLETTDTSETFERILESINTYLIRNKGAVADFNLLRDVTQRNLDMLEEEITIMSPLPLYLGLLGTMLGIVIGLFNMPALNISSFASGEDTNNLSGVNVLIDGVKYAMIASFAGLFFTVINSWGYRGAKLTLEHHKHDFFTFLSAELLPILTESVNAGIYDLNRSLSQFGTQFVQVANQLDHTVTRNYNALMTQQELLDKIQSMDLARVATFNIKVMEELSRSTASLERFATFLTTLNSLTENARQLVEKTNNVEALSGQMMQLLTESQRLQRFLMSHFEQLEQRGQVINMAVVKLDQVVDKSLDELQRHIVERVDSVRKITINEDELLLQAFERNRDTLKNLKHLGPLEKGVDDLAKQAEQIQQKNQHTFEAMLTVLIKINKNLEKQQEGNLWARTMGWLNIRREKTHEQELVKQEVAVPKSGSYGELVLAESLNKTLQPRKAVDTFAADHPLLPQSSKSTRTVIYFSKPETDGWFDAKKYTDQPAPDTCYQFTLPDKSATTASFSFNASKEIMSYLLNYRNVFINPVCESQNDFRVIYTRVKLLREGEAQLVNGQWRVKAKAEIEYL